MDPSTQTPADGPASRAWMPRVAIYVTLPLAASFIALRLYARLKLRFPLWADDYLAVLAMVASGGFCGVMLSQVIHDELGVPDASVVAGTDRNSFPQFMQQTCAITAAYCLAAATTKISLCALFLRLFKPLKHIVRMVWVGITFIALSYAAVLAVWIVFTVPRSGDAGWVDFRFLIRTSRNAPIISIVLSSLSILTDFYVIAIPLFAVQGLKLNTGKKIGVSALFATGLLACGFCVAGLPMRVRALHAISGWFFSSMPSYALAVAEINLGIVCACIPVAVPLFKGAMGKMGSKKAYKSYTNMMRPKPVKSSNWTDSTGSSSREHLPDIPSGKLKTLLSFVNRHETTTVTRPKRTITVTRATDIERGYFTEPAELEMQHHGYVHSHPYGSQSNVVAGMPGRAI